MIFWAFLTQRDKDEEVLLVSPREGVSPKAQEDIPFRVDEFVSPGKARDIGKIDNPRSFIELCDDLKNRYRAPVRVITYYGGKLTLGDSWRDED